MLAGVALLGCTLAAASRTDAAIVVLDVGPTGFNMLGANAGLAYGSQRTVANFPVAGLGLQLYNGVQTQYIGFRGTTSDIQFATNGGTQYANPRNFAAGQSIDGSAAWNPYFGYFGFRYGNDRATDFAAGSFMGFRFTTDGGSNWNYGWIEVTWTAATDTFEIFSAAYESTANLAMAAGAGGGGGGVPLPGAAGLAACGLLGLARRRRR